MKSRVFVETDTSLGVTHSAVGFDLGSLVDPKGKEGATSLLFRLMRRTAGGRSPLEVERRLDSLGASASVDVARSVATIEGTCLSRSFAPLMELVTEMLAEAPNSEEELQRLKHEAFAEWQDSLDNDALVARRFFARKLFQEHPYCRLTAGTPTSIAQIGLTDLRQIYGHLAKQSRLVALFAGDVSAQAADGIIAQIAGSLSGMPSQDAPSFDDPHVRSGRNLYFVDKPERSQVQILIGTSGAHPKDEDRTALYVGNVIFGGTFGARLSREVRGKRGWSYGAYSQLAHDRKRQSFSMWTFPQAADAAACISLQLQLFEELVDKGVTTKELSAAKKYLINSHAFARDTAIKRASLRLDQHIYGLPSSSGFKERVAAVTVDEVNAALRTRLSPQNLALVVLGTQSTTLGEVQDSIPDLQSTEVLPFDSRD